MVAGARTFSLHETLVGPQALKPPPTRHALLAFLIMLAAIVHLGTANWGDLHDGADGENAGAAREMLQTRQWLLPTNNGVPSLENPPLLIWLTAGSLKLFGMSAMAARIPIALAMVASVTLTFLIGERLFDYWRGFLAGLTQLTFLGAFLLGRTIRPEPVFSALIAGAILCALCGYGERSRRRIWFAGFALCCALATLTKGPSGLLIPAAICGLLAAFHREARLRFRALCWWPNVALYLSIVLPWYVWCAERFPLEMRKNLLGTIHPESVSLPTFITLHFVWWFPAIFLALPAFIGAWPRVVRSPAAEFSEGVVICWMSVVFVPLLMTPSREIGGSMSMWPALAFFCVHVWERAPARLRSVGICGTIGFGIAAGVAALLQPQLSFANVAVAVTSAAFRPVFAFASASIIVAGGLGLYLVAKQRERLAIAVVLSGMLPVGLGVIEGISRVSANHSLADAARFLNDRSGEHGSVFFEGNLHEGSSLLFYLHRELRLVNQHPNQDLARTGPHDKVVDEDAVLETWRGTAPLYLIIGQDRVGHWRDVMTERVHIYHQVATCGNYVVLSNQF